MGGQEGVCDQNGLKVRWAYNPSLTDETLGCSGWEKGGERGMILGTGVHSCFVWLQGAELGQAGASYSKTIQLNSKNFLSLRAGLEAVSSPVIIHLEQEGLTWEWKGGFLRWPDQEYVLEGL